MRLLERLLDIAATDTMMLIYRDLLRAIAEDGEDKRDAQTILTMLDEQAQQVGYVDMAHWKNEDSRGRWD